MTKSPNFKNLIFVQSEKQVSSLLEEGYMILDVDENLFFKTNKIGKVIWEHLSTPKSFEKIKNILLSQYDEEEGVISNDLQEYLQTLIDFKLIETKPDNE